MDQIVTTKRGAFGFIRVTVPMSAKEMMLEWHKNSGMGKAEFFRVALLIGTNQLAQSIDAKRKNEGFGLNLKETKTC